MAGRNGKKSFEERVSRNEIGNLKDSIAKLVEASNQDATAIRTLARIAEAHELQPGNAHFRRYRDSSQSPKYSD